MMVYIVFVTLLIMMLEITYLIELIFLTTTVDKLLLGQGNISMEDNLLLVTVMMLKVGHLFQIH